jgi:hypothetical protein
MNAPAIPLSEAPETFFPPAEWQEILIAMGNLHGALHFMSNTTDGLLEYAAQQLAEDGIPDRDTAANRLRSYVLRNDLRKQFTAKLIGGELIASGIAPTGLRQSIPADLWDDLVPNFVKNEAVSLRLTYSHVTVRMETTNQPPRDIVAECSDWLRYQAVSPKKVLQHDAIAHFGADLKTRDFDAAYGAVFRRPRGRPRNDS